MNQSAVRWMSLEAGTPTGKETNEKKALLVLGLWLGGLCWQNFYKVASRQGSSDAVPNPETITTG